MKKNGFVIVSEGIDGSGKTYAKKFVKQVFSRLGYNDKIIYLHDPGSVPISKRVRTILLDNRSVEICPKVELDLFCASREQLVCELIAPALNEGKIIFIDRFYFSTIAYQICGRERPDLQKIFEKSNKTIKEKVRVDHVIYFDVDPEVGLERKRKSVDKLNRIENEPMPFHKRVRRSYQRQYKEARYLNKKTFWHLIEVTNISKEVASEKFLNIVQPLVEEYLRLS